jgi:hypothetical protein
MHCFTKEKIRKQAVFIKRNSDFKILITLQGWLVISGWILLVVFNYEAGDFNSNSFLYKATIFLTIAVIINIVMVGLVKQLSGMKSDKEETPELVKLKKALFIADDLYKIVGTFNYTRGQKKPKFHYIKDENLIHAINKVSEKRFNDEMARLETIYGEDKGKKQISARNINPFHEEAEVLRKAASDGARYWQEDVQ